MKSEILTSIAMASGLLGVILSVLTFYRRKKAEQNFEALLKEPCGKVLLVVDKFRTQASEQMNKKEEK